MTTTAAASAEAMDIMEIMRLMPHRFPFLLIDRVDSIRRSTGPTRVGSQILAIKNVTMNEPFFQGHFPHRPVMPGVLQIEAMAQAAALLCIDRSGPKMDVAIAAINDAKFRKPVLPGDTLDMDVEITRDRGAMIMARALARVRGQVVCECEFLAKMFRLVDATSAESKNPGTTT